VKVLLKRFHLNGHIIEFSPTDSKVRITLNVSITDCGSERVIKSIQVAKQSLGSWDRFLYYIKSTFS